MLHQTKDLILRIIYYALEIVDAFNYSVFIGGYVLLKITETDPNWVEGFKKMIVKDYGAVPTEEPEVYDVPEDLSAFFHGCKVVAELHEQPWAESHADVIQWLNNYTGTFDFYLSLQKQLAVKGELSENQVASVRRAIIRDQERVQTVKENKVLNPVVQNFTISVGEHIRLNKWMAHEVARKAGLTKPHFVMEVLAVHRETPDAYLLDLKLSAQRTSHCCICGLKLTNKSSVVAGIGPICAEKWGVSFDGHATDELNEKLKTIQVVQKQWLPKSAIKERIGQPAEAQPAATDEDEAEEQQPSNVIQFRLREQ